MIILAQMTARCVVALSLLAAVALAPAPSVAADRFTLIDGDTIDMVGATGIRSHETGMIVGVVTVSFPSGQTDMAERSRIIDSFFEEVVGPSLQTQHISGAVIGEPQPARAPEASATPLTWSYVLQRDGTWQRVSQLDHPVLPGALPVSDGSPLTLKNGMVLQHELTRTGYSMIFGEQIIYDIGHAPPTMSETEMMQLMLARLTGDGPRLIERAGLDAGQFIITIGKRRSRFDFRDAFVGVLDGKNRLRDGAPLPSGAAGVSYSALTGGVGLGHDTDLLADARLSVTRYEAGAPALIRLTPPEEAGPQPEWVARLVEDAGRP
ncbi:MAG: hypothetical protein HXY25_02385, partial [Alphaproteobacteria bacterium]|nr:hypothetical protein [Alphaproteobacteria bacterium]